MFYRELSGRGGTRISVQDRGSESPVVENDNRTAHAVHVLHAGCRQQSANETMEPLALLAHDDAPWMRGIGEFTGGVEERAAAEVLSGGELPEHVEQAKQTGPAVSRSDALLD